MILIENYLTKYNSKKVLEIILDSLNCIVQFAERFQTLLIGVLAAILASRYEAIKTRLEDQAFKRDLFFRFNQRYDQLNDSLEKLLGVEADINSIPMMYDAKVSTEVWEQYTDDPANKDLINHVFDYINLCSEEYYWYKKQFIEQDVWACWEKGMQNWYNELSILQAIINRERKSGAAYYNKDFLDIFKKTV